MDKAFSIFVLKQKIELSEMVNGTVWAFRKIPLLGKILGSKYRFANLKYIIHTFYPIFAIIKEIIKSALAFGVVVLFVNGIFKTAYNIFGENLTYAADKAEFLDAVYRYFVPLYLYWLFALLRNLIEDSMNDLKKYYQNFRLNPEEIVKANLYIRPMMRFFARSVVLMTGFYLFAKVNPILTLGFSFILLLAEIGAAVFWMTQGLKNKKSIINNGLLQVLLVFALFLTLSHLVLLTTLSYKIVIGGIFVFSLGAFLWAKVYLKNFDNYGQIVEKSLKVYEDAVADVDTSIGANVKLKEKDLDKKKISGTGFAYLNRLFFRRHKRILLKPILIKSAIFACLLTVLIIFLPILMEKDLIEDIKLLPDMIIRLVPLITYMTLKQENILSAFFINCDQGLVHYGFYRKPKNLLAMYKARLISLLKINLVPALVYGLAFFALNLRMGANDKSLAIGGVIYIFLVAIFFTSLPLAQYYLLQPFNAEGVRVGKISGLLDMVLYIFCFNAIRITGDIDLKVLIIGSSIFIIAFTIITSLLILKIGPKTFRIKN